MHSRDLEGLYRRYQRNERLARQHWAALAGRCGAERGLGAAAGPAPFDTTASTHLPPSIPRGKPTTWYAERAQYYAAKAADAHDVY